MALVTRSCAKNAYYLHTRKPQASFVIDGLASIKPWTPRMLKIRGTADLVDHNGYQGPGKYIRIKPTHKTTININKPFQPPR